MKLKLNPIQKSENKSVTNLVLRINSRRNDDEKERSKESSSSESSSSTERQSSSSSKEQEKVVKEVVTKLGYELPHEIKLSIPELVTLIDTPEDRTHAVFGGSSASMWGNCLAHIPLMRQLKEQGYKQEQTEHTINGTMAHMCAELLTKAKLHKLVTGELSFEERVLEAIEIFINNVTTDSECAERASMFEAAEDYYEHIFEKALEGFITGKLFGFERQLTISKELDMSGYVDFWAIYTNDKGQRVGVIVDFKFGRIEVEAKNNTQLMFYGIALKKEEEDQGRSIDEVKVFIYQPKAYVPWKESKFTKKQLETGYKKLVKAAKSVVVDKKTTAKLGDHCTWCKAKSVCSKFQDDLRKTSGIAFLTPELLQYPEIPTLTLEEAAGLYSTKEKFEAMFSELGKFLFSQAKIGTVIPGFKLVKSRKNKTWIKDVEEVKHVLEALKDEYDINIYTKKPRALGQVQADLADIKKIGRLTEEFEDKFNSIWHKPEGDLVLVPEDHTSPAVEVTSLLTVIDIPDEKFLEPKEAISKMGTQGTNIMKVVSETISHVIEDDLV